jgi:hypothetical protein
MHLGQSSEALDSAMSESTTLHTHGASVLSYRAIGERGSGTWQPDFGWEQT